jgi:hypothetical protein
MVAVEGEELLECLGLAGQNSVNCALTLLAAVKGNTIDIAIRGQEYVVGR